MQISIIRHDRSNYRALLLFAFSLGNYGLMYVANIHLARSLHLNDFDDYSVAVSVVTLLSTIVTLGLEKYALHAIALFQARQDWRRLYGYFLFSRMVIAGLGFVLFIVLAVILELILARYGTDYHIAIVLLAGFLPVIGVALYFVEVLSALGMGLLAFVLYRLFFPLLFLCSVLILEEHGKLTSINAAISYGLAWCIILSVMWGIIKVRFFKISYVIPMVTGKRWIKRSLPLVISSLLMTLMTNSGVICLELLYPSSIEVAIYAVAAQTSSIINLIGTSTNRFYLPQMAVLLDKGDIFGVIALFRLRMIYIGGFILLVYICFAGFGQDILALFGNEFSTAYLPLVVISAGSCFSALYSDIPYYLQYVGQNRLVVGYAALAVLIMLLLTFFLGLKLGVLGVACAYALAVICLFLGYRWEILKHIKMAQV